ncbi:hypothetical protein TNCV_2832971 [Trichonephila clavipes]|nr:hypothetical protein TNCV_2832971 [Trichonephila clavipes]
MITNSFIPELNNHDVQELWFQQDGSTCHTARATIDLLNHSLVYADKPQTLDPLEDNIRRVIDDIRPQMLEKVIENWTSRLDYIRASRGSPMPEIIFKIDRGQNATSLFACFKPSPLLWGWAVPSYTSNFVRGSAHRWNTAVFFLMAIDGRHDYCVRKSKWCHSFNAYKSKYRRFAMLRRIFQPWQWKRRKKRNRFEQTSRTLERKIRCVQPKINLLKDVLMPETQCFPDNLPERGAFT